MPHLKYHPHTCYIYQTWQKQEILLKSIEYNIVTDIEELIRLFFEHQRDVDTSLDIYIEWKWSNYHIRGLAIEFAPYWPDQLIIDDYMADGQLWQQVFLLLSRLPAFISFRVQNLPIEHIHITEFVYFMKNLSKLTHFMVENTPIREIPPNVIELPTLQYLKFTWCEIEELPVWITDLPQLAELDLDGNKITQIPPLSRKITLSIAQNRLSEFQFHPTTPINSYRQIADNPFISLNGMSESLMRQMRSDFVYGDEITDIFEFPHMNPFKFGDRGKKLFNDFIHDENKFPLLKAYFQKSRQELKEKLVFTGKLSHNEQERLCCELSNSEKQELKKSLSPNHPFLDWLFPHPHPQIPTDELLFSKKKPKEF